MFIPTGYEKESFKDEIVALVAKDFPCKPKMKKLKGGLNDLSASKHVDSEKINQLEKDLEEPKVL